MSCWPSIAAATVMAFNLAAPAGAQTLIEEWGTAKMPAAPALKAVKT